ncbi:MAG: alpha/beta fold hydrolase [Proteobacteria bacterium]|nr:alpha/beta fold hydrolase [Pseudomonadota bacterium]
MSFVMPFLDRPGAKIYFESTSPADRSEDVPVITLINGHMRTSSDFKMMTRYLVEKGFRVLTLDNRGAGRSIAQTDFDLNDMAADVVAVWDHLGVAQSHVLGISMGGMIAQWISGYHGSRLRALVLVSTCPSRDWIQDHGSYAWSDDEEQVEQKLSGYFSKEFLSANQLLVAAMAKQMAKAAREGAFLEDSKRQMEAMRGFDATPILAQISAKVLVIHGSEDAIVPPAAAQLLADAIRGAIVKIFPGAGHLLLAERPKELYEVIARFFGGEGF